MDIYPFILETPLIVTKIRNLSIKAIRRKIYHSLFLIASLQYNINIIFLNIFFQKGV